MTIEDIQEIAGKLKGVSQDIKWGNDLVFSVGGKMFCAVGLDQNPVTASFKVRDQDFDEVCQQPGFKPAPYLAKHKWISVDDISKVKKSEWKKYIEQSYRLVAARLTAKTRKVLGI